MVFTYGLVHVVSIKKHPHKWELAYLLNGKQNVKNNWEESKSKWQMLTGMRLSQVIKNAYDLDVNKWNINNSFSGLTGTIYGKISTLLHTIWHTYIFPRQLKFQL